MKLPRQVCWLLLALFTALSLTGLFANGLFAQSVWHPSGLTRLAGYTGLFALIVGAGDGGPAGGGGSHAGGTGRGLLGD